MRALICGSREWDDREAIQGVLAWVSALAFPGPLTVIHGAARGADRLAGEEAEEWPGVDAVEPYPADWDRYGKRAGHIRNEQMLAAGTMMQPDVVYAFKDGFDWTLQRGGTEHMVKIAKEAGVPVYVVSRA